MNNAKIIKKKKAIATNNSQVKFSNRVKTLTMQKYSIFYETGEIDEQKLSPFERFQLEKYGTILKDTKPSEETETPHTLATGRNHTL